MQVIPRSPTWMQWVVLLCCLFLAIAGIVVGRREAREQSPEYQQ